ncbi:MAG TPA: Rrf2 family transcriptional regulator [Gammaproteobacteria bacterium]|nr:Rrf2 family transcriptional regulator [Gammaproteobacteria bacterium]
MRLTSKGRYAVTALLDIAVQGLSTPTTIAQLSLRHGMSHAYLERLTGLMRQRGFLKSIKGPGGGYVLGKNAEDITVSDIIQAVDESLDTTHCKEEGNCQDGMPCLTHHLWVALNQEIMRYLESITLQDLANRPEMVKIAKRQREKYAECGT